MRKEKLVTRTIKSTHVVVLMANIETGTCERKEVVIAGTPIDKELMKKIKSEIETDTLRFVKIESKDITEKLYGMSESTFVENASEITRSGKKENNND